MNKSSAKRMSNLSFYKENPEDESDNILVFVYGALMAKLKKSQHPIAAKVDGYKVSFELRGIPGWEPSFALLVPAPDEEAWGVLTTVNKKDWKKARKHELSYKETPLIATIGPGLQKNCIALTAKRPRKENLKEINPSARYSRMLYRSAIKYSFPPMVIQKYKILFEQGNRRTLYLGWWLIPVIKKLLPHVGLKKAFWLSLGAFVLLAMLVLKLAACVV